MHLCFLCNEYPPAPHGGIGSFTQTLARELVKHDHSVSVLRVPQGRIPKLRIAANFFRMQQALKRLHRERPIDLLEGADRSFFLVSPRLPIPKLLRMHGGYVATLMHLGQVPERQKVLEDRWAVRVATHLCACSRFVAEANRKRLALGDRDRKSVV